MSNNHFFLSSGHGHYGHIRVARPISNPDKQFAVKTIPKEKIKREMHLFKREKDIFRELDHPNIVKFYESYEDKKFFHVVMEYCSGGELFDRVVEKGHLDERQCSFIMQKIFSALKYLHERGIVHRDIKPENFLFANYDTDAEIKLIDFGLSRKIDDLDVKLQTKAGTPLYVSPEVLKGSYDYRCDYWSAGVTMYVLLSGRHPFIAETNALLYKKITTGLYSFEGEEWKPISKSAKDLISKLLVVDVNKRYDAQQALNHPWIKNQREIEHDMVSTYRSIENLKKFSIKKKFKKQALNVLVSLLSENEIKALRSAFRYCDKGDTGEITVDDLREVMKETGSVATKEEMNKLLESLQLDDKDTIRYSEFLAATMDSKLYLTKEKVWHAFKYFDLDNSNFITLENIKEVMKRAGKILTDAEIREMIKEVDLSQDGKISFEEFCEMMEIDEKSVTEGIQEFTSAASETNVQIKLSVG